MDREIKDLLFALLRAAICGTKLGETEREALTEERHAQVLSLAKDHDVLHLAAIGLKENGLLPDGDPAGQSIFKAVFRYERLQYDYEALCRVLEEKEIPFLPLKGAVLRELYPEPWMRTSCDVDVLVQPKDLSRAEQALTEELSFVKTESGIHDVTLKAPSGSHLELHFDLVEEDVAADAAGLLSRVWEHASSRNGGFFYEMTPAYFMLYHIAHMAKHFEHGGCGIRPLLDLWLLNRRGEWSAETKTLLEKAGLLAFAENMSLLSKIWLEDLPHTELTRRLEEFLLCGGVYGSTQNRVSLHRERRGGKLGYLLSRAFVPTSRLKRYFPVLENHPYLAPIMQVRRWFMLLRPDVAAMARAELSANRSMEKETARAMHDLLKDVGL